jgi:hypothetical protein
MIPLFRYVRISQMTPGSPDPFLKAADEDVVIDPVEGSGHRLPITVIFQIR